MPTKFSIFIEVSNSSVKYIWKSHTLVLLPHLGYATVRQNNHSKQLNQMMGERFRRLLPSKLRVKWKHLTAVLHGAALCFPIDCSVFYSANVDLFFFSFMRFLSSWSMVLATSSGRPDHKISKKKIDLFRVWGWWSRCWRFWSWGKVGAAFQFKSLESVKLRDKPDDVQFLFVLFCFATAIWLSVFSFASQCKNNLPIAQATQV